MALIDPDEVIHLEIPHEPGQWVEFKPLCADDLEAMDARGERLGPINMVLQSLVGWSYYDGVPKLADVKRLDIETLNWLSPLVTRASGIRSADEKKDSASPSLPTTALAVAGSRRSSRT